MRADEIRNVQHAQPFRPFTLHLADGREFIVNHRDFIWVSNTGRTVVVEDLAGNIEMIDSVMVTSMSVPVARNDAGGP